MSGLDLVERLVNVPYRHTIEIFAQIRLPAQNAAASRFRYPAAGLGDYAATADTALVGLARGVYHIRHEFKEQVVGNAQHYPVDGLVDVYRTELAVLLRYLCGMRGSDFVLPPYHGIGHGHTGMLVGQPDKQVFPDVFQHSFLNGLFPPADVEEHL